MRATHLFESIAVAPVAALLVLAASATASYGAISAPIPPHVDAEAKFKQDCFDAQESIIQRNKVAQERYQARMDRRARMIAGLKAELEVKKQFVTVASDSIEGQHHQASQGNAFTGLLVWVLLAFATALPVRYYVRARWPKLEPPPRYLTPVRLVNPARRQAGNRIKVAVKASSPLALPPPLRPLAKPQARPARSQASQPAAPASSRPPAWALS